MAVEGCPQVNGWGPLGHRWVAVGPVTQPARSCLVDPTPALKIPGSGQQGEFSLHQLLRCGVCYTARLGEDSGMGWG